MKSRIMKSRPSLGAEESRHSFPREFLQIGPRRQGFANRIPANRGIGRESQEALAMALSVPIQLHGPALAFEHARSALVKDGLCYAISAIPPIASEGSAEGAHSLSAELADASDCS
jgi:hypothetical protein